MTESNPDAPDDAADKPAPGLQPNGDIVATPGQGYRMRRYLIFVLFFGWGVWSLYDGFVKWPRMNAEARAKGQNEPHGGWDVPLNQILGFALPVFATGVLATALYNSRGRLRLSAEGVLDFPGHPPVPLSAIRRVDKSKWDRKGIALIDYELDDGTTAGTLRLDDFYYDQYPADEILKRVEDYLKPFVETPTTDTPAEPPA
jgi:hypothetical protein